MKVVIAGAGSIGLLIGSYLAESGLRVVFLVRREEQAALIREQGIRRVNGDGSERIFEADAQTDVGKLPDDAPWIVATKYGGVAPIVEDILAKEFEECGHVCPKWIWTFRLCKSNAFAKRLFCDSRAWSGTIG